MPYLFENLGDERFQQLCQALISQEDKSVQITPVGMPDGGRDAFTLPITGSSDFKVYQVKFVKDPSKITDVTAYMKAVIDKEKDKVVNLSHKGAKEYIIYVNIVGSSHLDTGSIDKINQYAKDNLPIETRIQWRDDIERRIDSNSSVRWAFPEILSGISVLDLVIKELKQRRSATDYIEVIKNFLEGQFIDDEEVKFKQVDLKNSLMGLFVDVPISYSQNPNKRPFFDHFYGGPNAIGAAEFILSLDGLSTYPFIILEGAPGQGKSTLAQFICQCNRAFILNKTDFIQSLNDKFRPSKLKTPVKIDLRDYALWLSGKNPFLFDEEKGVYPNHSSSKSLDSFLSSLISYKSGGATFNTDDFQAYVKDNPVLLLLDGFDEVADIKRRAELIDYLTKDIRRLSNSSTSLQVIVTSRPSAFLNAPEFSKKYFDYFSLDRLSKEIIKEYSEKWIRTKNPKPEQARDIRLILRHKIEQLHTAELTRDTMQLAIFLSLIYTKGNALPDKITALYDGYVDLFLDRESEKNELVRDNREILVDLHRYLGWHLHALAESTNSNGSLSKEEIIDTLRDYLEKEARDPSIAATLFEGMIQRVVFLVSRLLGRYEFEVQPLREYFAARHLYETAPSSSVGQESTDSKPDRLDALLRNPHWSNVTRFYVGCYSKGELPSIIDSIKNLIEDGDYKFTSYPYKTTASFLSDWVFSQSQRSTAEAIRIVLSALGRQHLLVEGNGPGRRGDAIRLPENCGKNELLQECMRVMEFEPHYDYIFELASILDANASPIFIRERIERIILDTEKPEQILKWLRIASYTSVVHMFSSEVLEHVLRLTKYSSEVVDVLFSHNAPIDIGSDENLNRIILGSILDGNLETSFIRQPVSEYKILSWLISTRTYSSTTLGRYYGRTLAEEFRRYGYSINRVVEDYLQEALEKDSKIISFAIRIRRLHEIPSEEWRMSLAPWEELTESIRSEFGEVWSAYKLAFISSNVVSPHQKGGSNTEVFNPAIPLCQRIRYMRLRRGQASWWSKTYSQISSVSDLKQFMVALLSWGSHRVLHSNIHIMNDASSRLNDDNWNDIIEAIHQARLRVSDIIPDASAREMIKLLRNNRAIAAISIRCSDLIKSEVLKLNLSSYPSIHPRLLYDNAAAIYKLLAVKYIDWNEVLKLTEAMYSQESNYYYIGSAFYKFQINGEYGSSIKPDLETAKRILTNANMYPRNIISIAEKVVDETIGESVQPLQKVAQDRNWTLNSQ